VSAPTKAASSVAGTRSAPATAVAPFDAAKAKEHQRAWAKYLGVPVEITNSIGMRLILIPPGEFLMGSTPEEIAWGTAEGKKSQAPQEFFDHLSSQAPQHRVRISRPYYLGVYPVTQAEYEQVTGVNPSSFTAQPIDASTFQPPLNDRDRQLRLDSAKRMAGQDTRRYPVETISWPDAADFCRRLSQMPGEQTARRVYRLPTEAEWEHACRAGTATRWWCGDDEAAFAACAWYWKNANKTTHPVGEKPANPWGLYDMHGHVWQRCADWYGADYYAQSPPTDPQGPPHGVQRVIRGGFWNYDAGQCRSANRIGTGPGLRGSATGMRVCLPLPETAR
jgi:formylglycine-generating enzyme required for sulfatase activity